jgi:hypothetical protein
MALNLYMDHHVPRAITSALRARQIDVLTAYENEASTIADPLLLDRATALDRVLFTRDDDLLAEATKRQQNGQHFKGIIYAHQRRVSIGQCIWDLELIATAGTNEDVEGKVTFLPL